MSILSELSQAQQQYSNKLNQPTDDYSEFLHRNASRRVNPSFDTVAAAQQDADALSHL